MRYKFVVICLINILFFIPIVHADGEVDLTQLPQALADALTIPLFAGQILTSAIFLALFLFPTLMLTRNMIAPLLMGMIVLGFCTAMTWLPFWFLLIICLLVALLFGGKVRVWITGGGERGD